tara:strand:- start:45 stop:473 length:429 start_codon:yes stop_codon:yes gene_type:complete
MKNIINKNINMKSFAILIMSVMFIWSGINKIFNFDKKVSVLMKRTGFPELLCNLGMVGVIILEILGFILLLEYYFKIPILTKVLEKFINQEQLVKLILILVILFIIVVTLIYHPLDFERPIPFLTNLTILGAFIYIYDDLFN